jgi:predicted nucleotidyltransferase
MIPEDKIQSFVTRLQQAGGENITSIVLYGSATSGNFREGVSNVNILCLVRDSSLAALQALSPAVKWWARQKQPAPLVMTRHDLERSTDVFTIELLDMQKHYRVLAGEDVLRGLTIPMRFHRMQVEYELREKLVLLRQAALVADGDDKMIHDLLLGSLPSVITLFRHALICLADNVPADNREAVRKLSERIGFDPATIIAALDLREQPRAKANVNGIFAAYLSTIEKVTNRVDEMLDQPGAKQ